MEGLGVTRSVRAGKGASHWVPTWTAAFRRQASIHLGFQSLLLQPPELLAAVLVATAASSSLHRRAQGCGAGRGTGTSSFSAK